MKTYRFKAEIKKHPKLNAAFVEFPWSVKEEFGTNGQVKVRAKFEGREYRGSLVKMGHHCHRIGLGQDVRKAINKEPGDTIKVEITRDDEPRIVEVPADLQKLFTRNKTVGRFFDTLSYTHRKEYVRWIESAKKEETRNNRLARTIEMLKEKIKHP